MFPIYTYAVTPNLFGVTRYQAEMDDMPVQFCRRAYSSDKAKAKLERDVRLFWQGRKSFMQRALPVLVPFRRIHDKACRRVKRMSSVRTIKRGMK